MAFKNVNSKRRTRDNIGLLLDEDGHLTSRDIDKAEHLMPFALLSSIPMMGLATSGALSWRTMSEGMITS